MMDARFRELARKRLNEEGRDADDPDALGLAVARERKVWTRTRLTDLGVERAAYWGWPNIYTYTKSLGEQLVAAETGHGAQHRAAEHRRVGDVVSLPRLERRLHDDRADHLSDLAKARRRFPQRQADSRHHAGRSGRVRDAGGVAARRASKSRNSSSGRHRRFQPNNMERIIGLVGLDKRKHFQEKETGVKLLNEIVARMEPRPVTPSRFEKTVGADVQLRREEGFVAARSRAAALGRRSRRRSDRSREEQCRARRRDDARDTEAFDMFRPFTIENAYVFRSDNVRSLFDAHQRRRAGLLTWNPEKFDWYDYWLNIHLPGLKKWVFPTLEDDMRAQPKRVYTYRDLLELFETSTKRHATRVAMRIERDGRKEQYTYADCASWRRAPPLSRERRHQAGRSRDAGQPQRARVGHDYFGVLKAGATCIPCDPESSTTRFSTSRAPEMPPASSCSEGSTSIRTFANDLTRAGLDALLDLRGSLRAADEQTEDERIALLPQRSRAQSRRFADLHFRHDGSAERRDALASQPDEHGLDAVVSFRHDTRDGVLSVLPLHHTFEFSTGFLTPLSRGAQITYLPELTATRSRARSRTATSPAWSASRACGNCCTAASRTRSTSAATGSARPPTI
jgi:long-chain acyl-CoA synthetase